MPSTFQVCCVLLACLLHTSNSRSRWSQASHGTPLRKKAKMEEQNEFLRMLQRQFQAEQRRNVVDPGFSKDFPVPLENRALFEAALDKKNISYRIMTDNLNRFRNDRVSIPDGVRMHRSYDPGNDYRHKFLTYEELNDFLGFVAKTATADVHLGSIGLSFEKRNTPFVKIKRSRRQGKKKTIFIDAGIHSREWIASAMAVEIIHRLALNQESDTLVDAILDMFDWIIVPLVNPDGYVYTFQPDMESRLWRKSRSTAYSSKPWCYGVDLNRNFGFAWNDNPLFGGSNDPCSGTYSGPHSFSEPETRNLRDLLLSNKHNIAGYLSFHSFGQFFLYPWGFTKQLDLVDESDLYEVATAFTDTMLSRNYQYHIGGSAKVLYPAAGASDDYVRGTVGVKYAYTVELPPVDSNKNGFLLPESQVRDIVTDTWAGLTAFAIRLFKQTLLEEKLVESEEVISGMSQPSSLDRSFQTSWNEETDGRLQLSYNASIEEALRGLLRSIL